MYVFKCKMCGGSLEIKAGETVCECEYCGTKQTVPAADNEKKMNLFNRANRLRFNNEFDKAAGIYESIITDFPEEAEAYWGLVLCKYGIEYVDDPATGKKIPTCHRSSFESVFEDNNFDLVMEYADDESKRVYRDEAKQIEELRKGIVEVSSREEPYDIFICYKETDTDGNRTLDSVIAQDIYDELTDKGYKVFFSRITLEDKLGTEYEPYIFAALHSAKVMLAVGTQYEYYDAVWVKNEWSRFLQLIAAGEKKTLIPVYKNLDAYDMPKEFAKLQAQDMGKVGAMQDLLRGIDKIFGRDKKLQSTKETVIVNSSNNISLDTLIKRAYVSAEDGDWDRADNFCEQILNQDPDNADAYLVKLLIDTHCKTPERLGDLTDSFETNGNYQRVLLYGNQDTITRLNSYLQSAKANEEEKNIERKRQEEILQAAKRKRSRIIKSIVILFGVIAIAVGTVFAVFPGMDKYISLRMSPDLKEQYVGFSSLTIFDAKERADQAYKNYVTELMNNEDYDAALYTIQNDNQYTSLVNRTGSLYDFQDTDIKHAYDYIILKKRNYNYSSSDLSKLTELKKIGYLDSEKMFMRYYHDIIRMYVNGSETDWVTNSKSLSLSDQWYVHIAAVYKAQANQQMKHVSYKVLFPDGTIINEKPNTESYTTKIYKQFSAEDMNNPQEGTMTVELYFDDDLIQTTEIQIHQ